MLLNHQKTTPFNPTEPEHREAVRKFMVRKAWGDTHLRFSPDPAYNNLVSQVQEKLLNWYLEQESASHKE